MDYGKKLHDLLFKAMSQKPAGNSLASRIISIDGIYKVLITDASGSSIATDIATIDANVDTLITYLTAGGDIHDVLYADAVGASLAVDIASLIGYLTAGGDIHDVLYDDAIGASLAVDIADIHTDVGTVDTVVDTILIDTDELQTDLTDGGRLDLILDELTTQGDTNEGKLGTEYANTNGNPEVDNVRAHIFKTGGLGGAKTTTVISYDGSASYSAFTVTGLVAVKLIGYITAPLSNHADNTSVGTATDAAGLIVATAGTSMQTANQIWIDNTPSKFKSGASFPDAPRFIGDGEDITVVGTANLVTGTVVLYCVWTPISSDGNVVASNPL